MKNNSIFLAVILVIFSVFFGKNQIVEAQGFNVEVSPSKINKVIKPGESYTQTFRIGNYSETDRTFYLSTQDFVVADDIGSPKFLNLKGSEHNSYSLRQWVKLPFAEIFIPKGEAKEVDVKITAPLNAEAGGHYGAFFVQTDNPLKQKEPGKSSIGSVGRIASLMLISVPGDIKESVILKSFKSDKLFYFGDNPKVELITTLENKGNVHAIPTGAFFVKGKSTYKTKSILYNTTQSAVLPGAPSRKISEILTIKKDGLIPPIGKFNVELLAKYGTQGNEISAQCMFWVLPIKFISIITVVLIIAVFIVWRALISFRK